VSAERQKVPRRVQEQVLAEAGYMCANPACRTRLIYELHHIEWVKDGGGNEPSNLLALCPTCHALHTKGDIPKSAIERWKLIVQALSDTLDRDSIDLLQFMYDLELDTHTRSGLLISGDGLLRLARLINLGFVNKGFVRWHIPEGAGLQPYSSWRPTFTDIGRRLVEAWRGGDAKTVRQMITGST
jgi:hypothetical protein